MTLMSFENGYAQNKKWNLKQCIDYAVEHNIEVKQSQNRIRSLKVERSTLKNSFLPNLNAGASQKFAFGRSLNQNNTYEDDNIQNSSFSLNTEVPLFTGFRTSASISCNRFDLMAAEANNSLRMSVLELMQLMELKGMEVFDIDSLNESLLPIDSLMPEDIFASAADCMPQIKQAYYSLQSNRKAVKVAQSGYYPTLSLGAGINSGYYHSGTSLNQTFGQQFRNNMQKSVYFSLSIPLFDRFSTRNEVRSARIEEQNAVLSLENEKKNLYKEIEKAYTDAVSAWEKLQSTTKAVAANEEAHRYALEKYAAGKSAVYEYNEIKMKLADALSKQSQAKYTYLLKGRILAFYSCQSLAN